MKACPECHGEGEVRDEAELQIEKRLQRRKTLAKGLSLISLVGQVGAALACFPAVVGAFYGAGLFMHWLVHLPLVIDSPVLGVSVLCGVIGGLAATAFALVTVFHRRAERD